jgi:thiamine biosynthesis lipoprotein
MSTKKFAETWTWLTAAVILTVLTVAGVRLASRREPGFPSRSAAPLVMGTTCRLVVVGPAGPLDAGQLDGALLAARRELEAVERRMSTYDPDSELSRFNRSPIGQPMPLSPPTLEVLRAAAQLSRQTGGAFDVTMRPLGLLWREAGQRDQLPDSEELKRVRTQVGFQHVSLDADAASRQIAGLEISLDAIAKGYAIHRAIQAMQRFPLAGGLVDVGGDIECFGRPADAEYWRIAVQDPRSNGRLLTLRLGGPDCPPIAVCTSGDYQRFVTIRGHRYSHILDPRTGYPVERAASVTVIGPDATRADGWATALSVLGPDEGLRMLPVDA